MSHVSVKRPRPVLYLRGEWRRLVPDLIDQYTALWVDMDGPTPPPCACCSHATTSAGGWLARDGKVEVVCHSCAEMAVVEGSA
jgi:hypothetical protein